MIKRPRAERLVLRHRAAVAGQPGGYFLYASSATSSA